MPDPTPLSDDELEAQQADLLPPREALTLLDTSSLGAAYPTATGTTTGTTDGTAATPSADGVEATGSDAAGDSAGVASKLTDGAANPATGYSPAQSARAGS